jgi:hypothetical protein
MRTAELADKCADSFVGIVGTGDVVPGMMVEGVEGALVWRAAAACRAALVAQPAKARRATAPRASLA